MEVHPSFASSSASSSSFLPVPVSPPPPLHLSSSSSPPSMSYPSDGTHHSSSYPSSSSGSGPSSHFRGYQYPTFTNNPASITDPHTTLPPPNIPSSSRDHIPSRFHPSSTQDTAWSQSRPLVATSRRSPVDVHRAPQQPMLYAQTLPRHQPSPPLQSPIPPLNNTRPVLPGPSTYPSSSNVPRLPPILQVEKQQVTTSATQAASASRRRNEAHFICPVPGCGSTFTRRFNLRGMYSTRIH